MDPSLQCSLMVLRLFTKVHVRNLQLIFNDQINLYCIIQPKDKIRCFGKRELLKHMLVLLVASVAAHKLFPRHFSQLFLEDSCENIDSDNRGTESVASWHLLPLMEIQCEEEEEEAESLCHCWLVTVSPAGSSWSWLMELSAGTHRERAGLFSHSLKHTFICLQQMGPLGAPSSFALPIYALSILHLNQWTGSWAQPPDLQVTSMTCPPS